MKKPVPPAAEHEVRELLLMAAARQFARRGYAATSVREIVEEAGVTKPVLYYYFQSKEGIFKAIMAIATHDLTAAIDMHLDSRKSAAERIVLFFDTLLELFVRRIEVSRLIYALVYGPPESSPGFDCNEFHRKLMGVVGRLVEEGIGTGEFRKVRIDDATWALLGIGYVAMESHLVQAPEQVLDRKALRRMLQLMLEGMRNSDIRRGI